MTADQRFPVEASLYGALRRARPDVRAILASKATMVATSHLVEDLVAKASGRHLLMSGFQHGRQWAAERDRYLALAGGSEVIAVFAGREPPPAWGVDHVGVRLRDGDPLTQEWFVLALGPEVAVTLCGLDVDGAGEVDAGDEEARLFEVIWSVDRGLAETAAAVVADALDAVSPEHGRRVREVVAELDLPANRESVVAREADHMLAGLLDRVERLRGRERSTERRANEAKTEFLSRMSHELRTPLNAILGFTQLLELDLAGEEQHRESLRHIAQAGRHLLQLIDEVLDISRIETGRLVLALETFALRDVLEEALALMRPLADRRRLTVEEEWRSAPPLYVHADPARVSQVLLNLLSNAIKYNTEGGRLRVAVQRGPDDTVRVAVTDTGPGIPSDELGRLFVPFERLPSTAGSADGTGLGLALALRTAQAMGGRIDVESRPGRGSTFTLVLPAARHAPGERPGQDPPIAARAERQVLCIEDNPPDVRLVERVLARRGDVELVTAARGLEGLALAREQRPDLVLLDLNLPDVPGEDVLRALVQEPGTAGVPVVVISSDAAPSTAERMRAAGAAAFLKKPIDLRHLLGMVGRLLEAPS